MEQRIIISRNFETELATALTECEHDRIFIITDETTAKLCWPKVKDFFCLHGAHLITIGATDANKTLDSLVSGRNCKRAGRHAIRALSTSVAEWLPTSVALPRRHSSGE